MNFDFDPNDINYVNLAMWGGVGLLVGLIISAIDRRDVKGSAAGTVFLSILGGIIGGFVGQLFFGVNPNEMNVESILPAAIGAFVLSLLSRLSSKPSDHFKTSVTKF
jgi:uncharacterized membrane protein YeaQ/YmgE (transglycosylase-associated protein family)